jgi:hypothetical protein
MINCYCRKCGLYISVPDDFSGGRGACPRCKTPLRIPKPLPDDLPDYEKGIRYIAEPVGSTRARSETPDVVRPQHGPSVRYHCSDCGESYESLKTPRWEQGQCPRCSTVNQQMLKQVTFPRPDRRVAPFEDRDALGGDEAVAVQAQKEADAVDHRIDQETALEMRGEFLLARPAANVPDDAQIIDGRPLSEADNIEDAPDITGSLPTDMEAHEAEPPESPEPDAVWLYLLQGKKQGPVSESKLIEKLDAGDISPSVLVYTEGMDGWHPIENVEALANRVAEVQAARQAVDKDQKIDAPLPPAPVRPTREIADACARLMWLFLAGAALTVLLGVTQDTFHHIGREVLLAAGLVLAILQAGTVAYGVVTVSRNFTIFRRLPSSSRTQAIIGIGGLATSTTIAVTLAILAPNEPMRPQPGLQDTDLLQAQNVFNVMTAGDEDAIRSLVDLEELNFFGRAFGEQYQALEKQTEKDRALWRLPSEFREKCNPARRKAEAFDTWRVESRQTDGAVVSVICPPRPDHRLVMAFQDGLLQSLTLEPLDVTDAEADDSLPSESPGSS